MAKTNYNDLISFMAVAREGSFTPALRLTWGYPSPP